MSETKERVLLLAYFFPPCNLTASQRLYAWAQYLQDYGYYPVVITRNWDIPVSKPEDLLRDAGSEVHIEHHDGYEVHYIPYRSSLRDRIYIRFAGTPLAMLSKVLTAFGLLSRGVTSISIPHYNLYQYAEKYARTYKVKKAVSSGNPFDMFKFGYLLNKRLGVKWVADYRDPWNSQAAEIRANNLYEKLNFYQSVLERKWVSTASYISTISSTILHGIQQIAPVQGRVVMNGFFESEYPQPATTIHTSDRSQFRIVHVGTVPEAVNVEAIVKYFIQLIDIYRSRCHITIDFVGVNFLPDVGRRIRSAAQGYEGHFITSDRMARQLVFQKQESCQMLLMCGHDFKGYPSSKIFEYVGLGKPVILIPSDRDIMEEILTSTGQGIICQNGTELIQKMQPYLDLFIKSGEISVNLNQENRLRYTRKLQTRELAMMLDTL